ASFLASARLASRRSTNARDRCCSTRRIHGAAVAGGLHRGRPHDRAARDEARPRTRHRPEELARVIDPFVRLDASRNRETGGAGLGLAIANELTVALRGALVLRNREDGGLEARVTLPA